MGFWGNLFGGKKKKIKARPRVSRTSTAVSRLARSRGCSIYDLDLYDDTLLEDLFLLGMILSDDGSCYVDDPSWVDPVGETKGVVEDLTAVDTGTFEDQTPVAATSEAVQLATETVTEAVPEPASMPPVYTAPEPAPTPEPQRSSWTSEVSESSWSSGSSDSGGSYDSGGGDD